MLKRVKIKPLFFLIFLGVVLNLVGLLVYKLVSNREPDPPQLISPEMIGNRGPVLIRFPDGADPTAAGVIVRFEPVLDVQLIWSDQDLYGWFDETQAKGTKITLFLEYTSLEKKTETFQWQLTVRELNILYLSPVGDRAEIWRADLKGMNKMQLTNTNGKVQDFDAAPNGNQIAFSVGNEYGGADIWQVDRDGTRMQEIVNCQYDICGEPAWSPDGFKIAYVRNVRSPEKKNVSENSGVWLLDSRTGDNHALFPRQNRLAREVTWSPDGKFINYLEEDTQQVWLAALDKSEESTFPCVSNEAGTWSPDSKKLFINCVEIDEAEAHVLMYEYSLKEDTLVLSELNQILGKKDYSTPLWSPDGNQVIFAERCIHERPTRQLWAISEDMQKTVQITQDVLSTHANYQWDPYSRMLIFQRFELGSSRVKPAVLLWDSRTGEMALLAENAGSPAWLP